MGSEENGGIYVFCKKCSRNVALDISEDTLKSSKGVSAVLCLHGDPAHAILAYIDKTLKVRAIEYPTTAQIEGVASLSDVEEESVVGKGVTPEMDIGSIVDSFGKNRKKGVEITADIIIQLLLGNPVYLVHTDTAVGFRISNGLQDLFEQDTSLRLLQPNQRQEITGPKETVFDLETKQLFVLGTKMDAHFFRQLIQQCIDDSNSFDRLRNELSKILYSFSKMMALLEQDSKEYSDIALAHEIAIDFTLMPILLKMAESKGIRVKDRVQKDGFGSALRSI